jgi:hypothetical protein
MALLYPKKPVVFNRGQLYPGNIYARPAIGPYYQGLRGFGQARRTSTESFEDALRSLATSPLAVNSQTYMDKVRERYGFDDAQLQNTLGIIGGVVGAGVGAGLTIKAAASRRQAEAAIGFRPYTPTQLDSIKLYNIEAAKVVDNLKDYTGVLEARNTAEQSLKAAQEAYDKVKRLKNTAEVKLKAANTLNEARKKFQEADKLFDTAKNVRNATVTGAREAAEGLKNVGVKIADEAVSTGKTVGRKAAGLTPFIGFAADVASLGISTAGLVQDVRAGDIGSAILSSIEVLGDATAVVGDVLEYTPFSLIGSAVSSVGTLVSLGVNALRVGFSVGEAVGRSLTPSGLKGQQLFAENLLANTTARPISTLAALTVQVGLPYFIGRQGAKYTGASLGNKLLYSVPSFLGNNVLGNQIRAGITMFASQTIMPLTQKVDTLLPTYNPEGADFVSAISLFGDLQDNLYGATRTKAILLGLASDDPNAKRDAIARAWGYSDKPAYALSAADVIEEVDALKNAPPIVKSVLGVVGEIILDPRNFDEMIQSKLQIQRTEIVTNFMYKELQRLEIAKMSNNPTIAYRAGLDKLVDSDQRGIFSDTNNPTTTKVIIGAVNAYLSGGVKELGNYITEQSIRIYKGIQVGNLTTNLPEQINLVKTMIDDIISGEYQSPLTLNNKSAQSLLAQAKKQNRIIKNYEKTGALDPLIKEDEMKKMQKFITLLGMRYNSTDMDVVATKLTQDLNVSPNITQLNKYYKASDAFANYMDLTDDVNSNLVFALNPIGRLIQKGETRFIRWFNEKTRSDMNTIENRMRTLADKKKVLNSLPSTPNYEAMKEAIENTSTPLKVLNNILAPNRVLTRSEELLVEKIKEQAAKDPEFAKIKEDKEAKQNYYNTLIDQAKTQQATLDEQKNNFSMRTIDYKVRGVTYTIDGNNYSESYKELEALRALENPSKEDIEKRNALSAAFVDYEITINDVVVYQRQIEAYQSAIQVLNLAAIKADDYAVEVLQSLYYFKSLFNQLIPTKVTDILEESNKKLEAVLNRNGNSIKEVNTKILENETKRKELESKFDTGFLAVDENYKALLKEYNELQQKLVSLLTREKEIKTDIEKNNIEISTIQKDVKDGKIEPIEYIENFDPVKFNEVMENLKEIERVNFLNGIKFNLTYVNKDGETITVELNKDMSRSFFIRTYSDAKEIKEVGIVLKDNFQTQINKLLNQYLGKDVFEDLLNYNHKFFDVDLKSWKAMDPVDKVKTIVAYIESSSLKQEEKDKLLERSMLRKIYTTIEAAAATKKGSTTTIFGADIRPETLYRYVMQEQMKLYKKGADPRTSNNPIALAFVKAAEIVKQSDDVIAAMTSKLDKFQEETIDEIKSRFENVLRFTPIYRYVKAYMYEFLDHDKNKLTLFKRASISEILPDSITKYDILSAVKNKTIATSIVNDTMESEFVKALLKETDLKKLREESRVKFSMNNTEPSNEEVLSKERLTLQNTPIEGFATPAQEERLTHEYDQMDSLDVVKKAANDNSRLGNKDITSKTKDKAFDPLQIRTQLDIDASSLYDGKMKNSLFAVKTIVKNVLTDNSFTILPKYLQARLNMSVYYSIKNNKNVSVFSFLEKTKRGTVEYKEKVGVFSYKLAWLYKKYPDLIELDGIDISKNDSVETISNKITDHYLKKNNVDVRINMEQDQKGRASYTALFKTNLIRAARNFFGKEKTVKELEALLSSTDDDILNSIVREANEQVHTIIKNNRKNITFLETLNDFIVDLREYESTIMQSILDKTSELNPSIRKKAILKSKEIRTIFKDLSSASLDKSNSDAYSHIFFKLLHAVKDYYTEDYATKNVLQSFDNFNEIKQVGGEIIVLYKTDTMKKPLEYTLFDLIFIHGIGRTDFLKFVDTVGNKMGASSTAKDVGLIIAAAKASYDNLVNEYGQLLTHNAFSIDKEIFMKQEGATEELYELFSDSGVNELRQRLLLVNKIFEQDPDTNKIDFNAYYDNRYRSYINFIERAVEEYNLNFNNGKPTKNTLKFYAFDKNDNKKELFTINLLNKAGTLREKNVLILLTLLKLSELNKKNLTDLVIASPEGYKQSAYIDSENVKAIIKNVFFKDVKPVKGKAQNTNIIRLEKLLKTAEEELLSYKQRNVLFEKSVQYKRTINNLKTRIDTYKALIKEFTAINKSITIDPYKDFEPVYDKLIKDEYLAESYFTSVINTDGDDFVIAKNKKGENRLYRKKDIADFKDSNTGKGIPSLNFFFVNYVFKQSNKDMLKTVRDRVRANEQFKNVEVKIATEDGSAVVVVDDKKWSFDATEELSKALKRVMNNNYENNTYDISEVYVLSNTKYKEIKALENVADADIPKVDLYTVGDDVEPLPEVINVQSDKLVVNLWLHDLNLIYKDRLDSLEKQNTWTVLNKLSEFYNARYSKKNLKGFVPVLKSYGEGVNVFNTETFQRMVADAKVNMLFYEFYEGIGRDDFDLETIGRNFFKSKYLSEDYNIDDLEKDLDPILVANLKNRKLYNAVVKSLVKIRKKYKENGIIKNISYDDVFKTDSISELLKLKNSIYSVVKYVERTNKTAYQKLVPIIERHLKTNMGEDVSAENIRSFFKVNNEVNEVFYKKLDKVFADPFKEEKNAIKIFDSVKKERFANLQNVSVLEAQQYAFKTLYDSVQISKQKHYDMLKKHKESINYLNFTTIRVLFRDLQKGLISPTAMYKKLKELIVIPETVSDQIKIIANKLFVKEKDNPDGYASAERIMDHLIYGYVIKSYLVSIKQFMDRNVNEYNQYDAGDYQRVVINAHAQYKNKIKNKTATAEDKALFAQLDIRVKNLETKSKDVRYKFNLEHLVYKGNDTYGLFNYVYEDTKTVKEGIAKGVLSPVGNVKIDEHISAYVKNKFDFDLDTDDATALTKAAGEILDVSTGFLFGNSIKEAARYIPSTGTLEKPVEKTEKLKKELIEEGFTESEIRAIFDIAETAPNKPIYAADPQQIVKLLNDSEDTKKETVNRYIKLIQDARKVPYKIKKILLDYKQIFAVNRLDLLETSDSFFEYFQNVVRNNSYDTPFEEIVKAMAQFGISREEIDALLSGEYNSIQHFINAHMQANKEPKGDDYSKASLLMLFINYHKQKFISDKLNLKDVINNTEEIKIVRNFETIRDKKNNLNLQTININDLFGEGNSINNGVNFQINRGFTTLNKINGLVNFYNDRLGKIILDDGNIKDNEEYTGEDHGVIFKTNNVKVVASEVQRALYEPLFKETDAGFVGSRAYELMLMRREFIQDMMAENASKTRNVGSSNILYNNIRSVWTGLLETVKTNFHESQFVRVRDVGTAIKTLSKDKSAANFFIEEYNFLVAQAREAYINKNDGDNTALAEKFDAELKAKVESVIKLSLDNNKLVTYNESSVKAILGFIYMARFVDSKDILELQNRLTESVKEQLQEHIKYKRYKFNTISSVIKRIIKSNADEKEKQERLANLQGKAFKDLTVEQQSIITTGLRINKFISSSEMFFNPKQFYDTFDVAYGKKRSIGAFTTVQMQVEENEELEIKDLDSVIQNKKNAVKASATKLRNIEQQNNVFKIKDASENYTYDENTVLVKPEDIIAQADLSTYFLEEKLEEAKARVKKEEEIFKAKKIELVKELFKLYPGLRKFYLEKAEASVNVLVLKQNEKLTKLDGKTNQFIIDEYKKYIEKDSKIKEIEESKEYKVMMLLKEDYDLFINFGYDIKTVFNSLYDSYKNELNSLEIYSMEDLVRVYIAANKSDLFNNLKTLRNERAAFGNFKKTKDKNEYNNYVKVREVIQKQLDRLGKRKDSIQLSDTEELSSDDALDILTKIIADFKKESYADLGRTFKTVDKKDNFTFLTEESKKQIEAHHRSVYMQKYKYLKQAYEYIRAYNVSFGLADKKDLGKVTNDTQIKPAVLAEALNKEIAILNKHQDNLTKILVVPTSVKLPELKENDNFKKELYFRVALELQKNKISSELKRTLTTDEIKRIAEQIIPSIENSDVLTNYNYVFGYINNPNKNYNPIKHNFGANTISIDLSKYTVEQVEYAEALLNNVNSKLVSTYNESIDVVKNKISKQIRTTELNIETLLLEADILERKNKAPTKSNRENLKGLFNNLYKDISGNVIDGIDDQTIDTLLRFVNNNKTSVQIVKARKEEEDVVKQIAALEAFKKELNGIPSREEDIKTLESTLENKRETLIKTKAKRERLYKKELEVAGDRLSNLELFKHYYKIDKNKPVNEIITTVLDMVKERYPDQDIAVLERFIRERGDYAIHNSVVDALITLFNYKHQKPESSKYVVVDLETYTLNGENIPYQMTMIYESNGKISINDVYINSGLFFDGVNDDGSYKENMMAFYQQQKSIWKDQWASEGLTEEAFELKAKTAMDKLIANVRKVKNNDNFINAFLTLIGDQQVEIVAHNGYRFDFNIIKNFVSRIGNNLIVNEYYRNLTNEYNVRTIYENIEKTNLNDDEITKAYVEELKASYDKLIEELNKKLEFITPQETERFKQSLDAINIKITDLRIKQAIKTASESTGYILNDNIRKQIFDVSTGAIKYINDELIKYVNTTDEQTKISIKNNLVLRFMEGVTLESKNISVQRVVIKYVDDLLTNVKTMYDEYVESKRKISFGSTKQGTSVKTELNIEGLKLAGVVLYEEDVELDIGEKLNVLDGVIETNNNLMQALKLGSTPEEIVTVRNAEIDTLKESIKKSMEAIDLIKKDQNVLEVNNEDVINKILEVVRKINNLNINGYASTINIALNIIKTSTGNNTAVKSLTMYENQQKIALDNLTNRIAVLVNLKGVIDSGVKIKDYTPLLGNIIDTRLLNVLNGSTNVKEALESVQKDIATMLKADKELSNPNVQAVLRMVFDDFIKGQTTILNKTKPDLIKALEDISKLLKLNVEIVDGEIIFEGKKVTSGSDVSKIYKIITQEKNQELFEKNTAVFSRVTRLLDTYEETLNIINVPFEQLIKEKESNLFRTFETVVNERYSALLDTKNYLESYKENKTTEELETDALLMVYKEVMKELTGHEVALDNLKNESILSLITGDKPSDQMTEEQYINVASSVLDLEEVNESATLKKLNIAVHYEDAEKSDDIKVVRIVSNKVLSKTFSDAEESTNVTYVYDVLDEDYNETNKVVYNTKSNTLDVTLKYAYIPAELKYSGGSSRGYQVEEKNIKILLNPKENRRANEYSIEDLKAFIAEDSFYWKDTKTNKKYSILPNVKESDLYFPKGVDSSRAAITTLLKWVINNKDNFKPIEKKDGADVVLDKLGRAKKLYESTLTHEGFAFNSKYLKVINISKMIKDQFFAELNILQSTRKVDARELKDLYSGIYNRITSRYKALEPGSIVNQINSDYTYDYNLDSFDDAFLEEHKIDLSLNSEGSAGAVFKFKTRYPLDFPFALSTNSIRTMLSGKHILAKYTTIKFLNDIYRDIKTKLAPGKELLTTFINNAEKYLENKEVRNTFIRKAGDNYTQVFMPNVMSESLYKAYKDDSMVHQFGNTVPVAFVRDPRIPLDVIAIDADYAKATGWGLGNKTWLGLHAGFKGGVMYVPGLYKTYGSYFAADSNSVFSRGTAGVYEEMLFNYIRAYLLDERDLNNNSVVPTRTSEIFSEIKEELKTMFEKGLENNDNVLIVDSKGTYEIMEDISDLIKNKVSVIKNADGTFKYPEFNDVDVAKVYQILLMQDFKNKNLAELPEIYTPTIIQKTTVNEDTLDLDNNKTHERVFIKTDLKNSSYVRGLVYVYADHENSAQSMHTITKVNTAGKLIRNIVDGNNNPIKGLSVSPTVANAIYSIIGRENYLKVFNTDHSMLTLLADVRSLGFKTVISNAIGLEDEKELNESTYENYLNKLLNAYENKKIHEYVYLQGSKYLEYLYIINTSKEDTIGYKKELEKLVSSTESNVIQKMYDGKNSAYYKGEYKKWDGIRQQFLADVTLDAGEIVLSEEAWKAIVKKDTKNNTLIKTEELTNKQKVNEYIKTLLQFGTFEEKEAFLKSRGIFEENNADFYALVKSGSKNLEGSTLYQTYTYLLSARSPVQDYGAVPVFKAIGYTTSYAANVNVYAYNMMGADNDGDTFGMALLKVSDVEGDDAPLKGLLATNLNYYSFDEKVDDNGNFTSYLVKSNEEMFAKDTIDYENLIHTAGNAELISYRFTRNQTGKKTLDPDLRPSNEYLEVEQYRLIESDMLSKLGDVVKDDIIEVDEKLLKLYVNAHIRINNQGRDYENEKDSEAPLILKKKDYESNLQKYYKRHKGAIDLLYTIESNLVNRKINFGKDIKLNQKLEDIYIKYFSEDEQKIIRNKDHEKHSRYYKRLVLFALTKKHSMFTTSRIRASKNAVGYTGNKRKDQLVSSFISTYPNINKSKQGLFWKLIGATNKEGEVTIDKLIKAIAGEKYYIGNVQERLDKIKQDPSLIENEAIKNPKGIMKLFIKDLPLILNDLEKLSHTYFFGIKELEDLQDLFKYAKPTYNDYLKFVTTSSKRNNPVISNYIKNFSNKNPEDFIPESFIKELSMFYFNNHKTAKDFMNGDLSPKGLMAGYGAQYIIERVAQNNMSNLIQRPISMSKHEGLDSNPNATSIQIKKDVDNATVRKSILKVILDENSIQSSLAMAINMDRNMRQRIGIETSKITSNSLNKEYYDEYGGQRVHLKEVYTKEKDVIKDINDLISQRTKLFLLGNLYMSDTVINKVYLMLEKLNRSLRNPENYLKNKEELLEAIQFFNLKGIPFYKLGTFLRDVLSIKESVSERYVKAYSVKNKDFPVIQNAINIIKLMYKLRTPDYKNSFDKRYGSEKDIINFFSNVNDMTEGWFITDGEGNRILIRPEDDPSKEDIEESYTAEDIQNATAFENSNNSGDIIKTPEELAKDVMTKVSKQVTDRLQYATFSSELQKIEDVIADLKLDVESLIKTDENLEEQIKETKKTIKEIRQQSNAQKEWNNRRTRNAVRNSSSTKAFSQLQELANKKKTNEDKIRRLESDINSKERTVEKLTSSLKKVENIKDWYATSEDPIKKLENENKNIEKEKDEIKSKALQNAVINNLGGGVLLLRTVDGYGLGDSNVGKPRYLTQEDLTAKRISSTLAMSNKVTLLTSMIPANNVDLGLKIVYEFAKTRQADYRLVQVDFPYDDEGAYKDILSEVRRFDANKDSKTVLFDKFTSEEYAALKFKTLEELQDYKGKVVFNGKVYDSLDPKVIIKNNRALTPTYKEIVVRSVEELREYYDAARGVSGVKPIIGFIDLNTWMQSMEDVYSSRRMDSKLEKIAYRLQLTSKNLSKFSAAFLFRNMTDTVYQLFSNALILPKTVDSKDFLKMTMTSLELYGHYKKYSDEHTAAIINIGLHYEDILELSAMPVKDEALINNKISLMKEVIETYINVGKVSDNQRIKFNLNAAEKLLKNINRLDAKNVMDNKNILYDAVTFIHNIKFGEFLDLYDNKEIDGNWVAGLRIDSRDIDGNVIKNLPTLNKVIKDYKEKKGMLKQLSAFMNTAATSDYLRKDNFELLPEIFEKYRGYDDKDFSTKSYEEIKDMITQQRKVKRNEKGHYPFKELTSVIVDGYDRINTYIENAARITNFFYNLSIYNKTFDESVMLSLRSWFNYGLRSPLEQRLMADIPFISFPVRSVQNWIDRINNPRWWRFMSDFFDGWYGQYVDEETKEHNDFIKYQMRNGWIPIGKNFGLRIGNGALDVMNMIYNTQESFDGRISPILRAVKTLVEKRNVFESLNQLASLGLIGRIANSVTGISDAALQTNLRERAAQVPVARDLLETRKATIGTTTRGFAYDIRNYEKYTPRKYQYGRNGRWAKYENIYKDWFNKYGRMRRPTTDPYRLVKNIQWRQYVRWRQTSNILR